MTEAYCMDCLKAMRQMPDKAFDLAVVDPPYGIGVISMMNKAVTTRRVGNAKAIKRDYKKPTDWDVSVPDAEYFRELMRVSKKQIIWGGNYFSNMLKPSNFICWDKRCNDAMVNNFADCELAWMSPELGPARMFRYVWNGMLQGNMRDKEERFHPTQKPVALYAWIYQHYAKKGDRILDTHLGSGSSRIAAYDAGLDFVGYEIDPDYFQKQEQRFAEHIAQLSLFDKIREVEAEQISMEVINNGSL